jgi:two-component system chemotaxis response regulator CheY
VLTTVVDERLKEQARAVRASGWMVKPFDPAALVEVIKKVVR